MMVPPLFDMRLCYLSVPSAAVLDDPTLVTAAFIRITGSVPGSVVTGFVVEWQRDTSVGCSDEDERTISENVAFIIYTTAGLESGNRYTITVTVSNSAGTAPVSSPVTAMTLEAGERESTYSTSLTLSCHSLQLRLILQCLEKALSQPEVSQLSGMSWLVWTVME